MITTVIFDLDDTLYDELDYCRSGMKAVAHFLGETLGRGDRTTIFEALCQTFEAGNHDRTFDTTLERLGIAYDGQLIKSLVRVYRAHKPNLRLPPESRRILSSLRKNYKLGLLTDGFLPAQRLKVESLGLASQMDTIVYTEHLGREHWKPSSRGFELIMLHFDQPGVNMVYVGDNASKDFLAPNQLGWHTIQIARSWGFHGGEAPVSGGQPRDKIDSLGDLEMLLEGLHAGEPQVPIAGRFA